MTPIRLSLLASVLLIAVFVHASQPQTVRKLDSETALLVIDIQQFYFPGGALPLTDPVPASLNAKKLIEKFRAEKRLVIHVGHNAKEGAEFHPNVEPRNGEKVIFKNEVSAFNGTDLAVYLEERGIKRLVIIGMQTHMCVEGAVRAAYDLGFECILVHDACATRPLTFNGDTITAGQVHNSTLSTLSGGYATVVDTRTFMETY